MKNLSLSLLFVMLVLIACNTNDNPTPNPEPISPEKAALVAQNNAFSLNIFQKIVQNEEAGTNVFISPLSMYYALSMAAMGSDTETRIEFESLLGWSGQTEEEVLTTMQSLYSDLMPPTDAIKLSIANSIWQNETFPVKDAYKDLVQNYFDAEARTLNFSDPASVDVINGWIEDKTNGLIQDMLDQIAPDAVLYLINAIYFKGDWKYIFKEEDNEDLPFYTSDDASTNVTFMHQKTNLKSFKNDYATLVELPYSDSNYCMTMYLPNQEISMETLLQQLTSENLATWQESMEMSETEIYLPKFKFTFGTRNINPELQDLGLLAAYSPLEADFSKITTHQIFINRVLHKAFIEVNEKGSEAAAATIVEFIDSAIGDDDAIRFNRPFVFTISHKPTKTLLFMGKVALPEQ